MLPRLLYFAPSKARAICIRNYAHGLNLRLPVPDQLRPRHLVPPFQRTLTSITSNKIVQPLPAGLLHTSRPSTTDSWRRTSATASTKPVYVSRPFTSSKQPPFPPSIRTADLTTIDLLLLQADDQTEMRKLHHAASTQGFLYLRHHGIDPSFLFDLASSLFSLPVSEKMKYDMGRSGHYFGYKPRGSQYIDANGTPDKQEYFNLSKDEILGDAKGAKDQPHALRSQWNNLETFTRLSHGTALTLLRAISAGLNMDPSLLLSRHELERPGGDHTRVTWTPPGIDDNAITFGGHTDFGSITLLFNQLGGLQIINPEDEEWMYVEPRPECAIVNFGDSIVKLLGGRVHSGMHRVVRAPGDQSRLPRVSVAYFMRPNGDVQLKSVMPDDRSSTQAKAMTADEWIVHRAVHRNTMNYKGRDSFVLSKGTEHRDLEENNS